VKAETSGTDPLEVERWARLVWDYHHLNHPLAHADCILVLGSHDIRVAERGAQLFLQGWAPLLVFSGGLGRLTEGRWNQPEARLFAEVALKLGVPAEKILIEDRSTNTGENIQLARQLLAEQGVHPQKLILVQKPYMERRAYATLKQQWPDVEALVTSPPLSFEAYPNAEISQEEIIHIMVGDLQRIKLYAERGFQIPQEIPAEVWQAYERLAAAGYVNHLIAP
jgi:uncharacterized SAM-binding protein YcdF (DUF218 family)